MDVNKHKQARSKAKQTVTISARRLITSSQRSPNMEVLTVMMSELENSYSDFVDIDNSYADLVSSVEMSEHRTVNGETLKQYTDTVNRIYEDAKVKFVEAKLAAQYLSADPVRTNLNRDINRISSVFRRIEDNLSSPQPEKHSLQFDTEALDALICSINNKMEKLQAILSSDQLDAEHEENYEVNNMVDKVKREVYLFLKKSTPDPVTSDNVPSVAVSSSQPIQPISVSVPTPVYSAPVNSPVYAISSSYEVGRSTPASYVYTSPPVHNTVYTSPGNHSDFGRRSNTSSNSEIKLKRLALPTFSGKRRDWPEFKAVWRELAENAFDNKTTLAHELKRSVRGEAAQRIKSVFATKPEAYYVMWHKLETYYDDTSASVQAALESLQKLKLVKEDDFKGLVELIDEVEAAYSQLEELGQLETLTMRDVDQASALLPTHLKFEWIRRYHDLSAVNKVKPFVPFMKFLEREREVVSRLADAQLKTRREYSTDKSQVQRERNRTTYQGYSKSTESNKRMSQKNFYPCAVHRRNEIVHVTADCSEFKKLEQPAKVEKLMQVNACFICFGDHPKANCPNRKPCTRCKESNHHPLICRKYNRDKPSTIESNHASIHTDTNATDTSSLALYPIQQVVVAGTGKTATIFCDGGSNTTYITHRAADRIQARKLNTFTLDVTTMGNVQKSYNTRQYEMWLQTQSGKKVKVVAFGMENITGAVSKLDTQVLSELFPDYDVNLLQRKSNTVDILLGCDYFGLHPKTEVAKAGENLSIMFGEFGICLQGTHSRLKEDTILDCNLARTVHDSQIITESGHSTYHLYSHHEFVSPSHQPAKHELPDTHNRSSSRSEISDVNLEVNSSVNSVNTFHKKNNDKDIHSFIQGEELCTGATPRCGACRCGKCPTVGHTYSFKEEQELRMIQDNLRYDEERKCWITSYPWIVNPSILPDNYKAAYSTLLNTERTLCKDSQWADTYKSQIQDMIDRQVARKLSDKEMEMWKGPQFYISHLAVLNPKSQSTPVRIVFNSSQVFQGVSLNSCLAKGPDAYLNNLVGLLLRWREEHVAVVGDIKKMFNSIHLEALEQQCHRFLWRDLEPDRKPDVYVIERVNMGDTPAPAISTEAIYKTADMFHDESPRAAELLKKSSYVDDLIDSFDSMSEAQKVTSEAEMMLSNGGFRIKCWQFSGESSQQVAKDISQSTNPDEVKMLLKGTKDNLRVLGLGWKPVQDVMIFQVTLNFSKKKKGQRLGPNIVEVDIPKDIPVILTRRMVLEQVMVIYDPLGLLSPFTLLAKVYLRETWELKLGWDEQLPANLRSKWVNFFSSMFELEHLKFQRCLHPPNAVGDPTLVILSDGSNIAYGFAAYIMWKLKNGEHWLRLIMAKCRIAPINRLSTPQMELNGAVLSKRASVVCQKEMRFNFERIFHLVDSETVLNMLNKTSTRYKVYEGVRIGEIQSVSNGDMSNWAWISGDNNTADWLTKGRTTKHLGAESEWWNGPSILYKPEEDWGLKFGLQQDIALPGERKVCRTTATLANHPFIDYNRYSSINRIIWIVARLHNMVRHKSFKSGQRNMVTAEGLREAENFIVKDIQSTIVEELQKVNCKSGTGGRYARLNPGKDSDGIWVVGQRMQKYNAMTADSQLQKLLPNGHFGTRLFMRRAHQSDHRGRNATLAKFRQHYWVPHGDKLAKSVKSNCQLCKLREPILLKQEMGLLPEARLKPTTPFNHVMLDLFGPYSVRGEVQKRISGKAYGVIFTDLTMRAVHIEAVYGYDTSSFLMALSRFTSIRGWPETVYSDPGTQLIGAEYELKEAWKDMKKDVLITKSSENGLTWIFGPADSPWHQGAVESLVKSAKRAINFAVHNQRLSVPEFLTVCTEVSNLLNERPIGATVGEDEDINIFTPNSLLLGRATAKNPGGWQPHSSINSRYRLVQDITDHFWKKWIELYAPTLVIRQKWSTSSRNLQPGDVVIVADKNTFRGEYRLGLVKEVFTGEDSKVRQVTLTYKNYKIGEKSEVYNGVKDTTVTRSVQRLALIVPVDYKSDVNSD